MAGCTKVDAAGASRLIFLLLLLFTRLAGASRSVLTLQDGDVSEVRGSQHFCYVTSAAPGWKEAWTRIQVRVWSSAELKVTVVQDEQQLEDLEHFSVWTFVQYFIREQTNETSVNVNLFRPKTCFRVDPSQPSALYTVKPARKFDIYMFLVFLMGVALFFMANTLSRSQIFYYSAGMSTGLIASLLILIFLMARFLPKPLLRGDSWRLVLLALRHPAGLPEPAAHPEGALAPGDRLRGGGGLRQLRGVLPPRAAGGGAQHQHPVLGAAALRRRPDVRRHPGAAGGPRRHRGGLLLQEPGVPRRHGLHRVAEDEAENPLEAGAAPAADRGGVPETGGGGDEPRPRRAPPVLRQPGVQHLEGRLQAAVTAEVRGLHGGLPTSSAQRGFSSCPGIWTWQLLPGGRALLHR
ncbi:nuclear envelope integral membrane protein 1-like isoform X3 [Denticeps clupeoides]|uniref:nuclear envelope integral membrane protein 1-like isoform X3 n=1 Tax=Denticeps clupeoides TaxID=299321 RepID=UPI0010A3EB81|nr:nuclear envelope integral membrane protein 1-like isoform X3 [Denticeps clupeoides]XP_028849919.1 nuclear envelope integral membrane protein 1-like isoform X3 [Denticeps clupeoides]XP_028849955.1 nuclear envelope integral membrane protein 1-like isoform X3 [Denticeps clupeoides]XP_028849956.1 nuclear envelope integral membrane protein 1-like isoform X3 [Denticeps clupeoides]